MKRLLIFLLILLVACSAQVNLDSGKDFEVKYSDGKLHYKAKIEKPTPCHSVDIQHEVLESDPVQIIVNVTFKKPDDQKYCIQVIEETFIEGSINIDKKPGRISVVVEGQEIYSESDI